MLSKRLRLSKVNTATGLPVLEGEIFLVRIFFLADDTILLCHFDNAAAISKMALSSFAEVLRWRVALAAEPWLLFFAYDLLIL